MKLLFISVLLIYSNSEQRNLKLCYSKFNNDKIICASVAGKTKGEITIDELMSAQKVKLMNNSDSSNKILSFSLALGCKGYDLLILHSLSDQITEEMRKALSNAKNHLPCAFITFGELKYTGMNKDTIYLPDLVFHIGLPKVKTTKN